MLLSVVLTLRTAPKTAAPVDPLDTQEVVELEAKSFEFGNGTWTFGVGPNKTFKIHGPTTLGVGAIIGIVIGILCLLGISIWCCCCCCALSAAKGAADELAHNPQFYAAQMNSK